MTAPAKSANLREGQHELVDVIGEAAMVSLASLFAGRRLYVPAQVKPDHAICRAIGIDAAKSLVEKYSGSTIRVPLARELRAKHLQSQGLSNAAIAGRLGLTEGGVRSLFKRLDSKSPAGTVPGGHQRNSSNVGT